MQLYGSLLWKSENVCHNCGTKQDHPLHRSVHALKHKAIPGCITGDKVVSYYNTVGQIYQNSLKSHLNSPGWDKMTTLNVQEYLFGK